MFGRRRWPFTNNLAAAVADDHPGDDDDGADHLGDDEGGAGPPPSFLCTDSPCSNPSAAKVAHLTHLIKSSHHQSSPAPELNLNFSTFTDHKCKSSLHGLLTSWNTHSAHAPQCFKGGSAPGKCLYELHQSDILPQAVRSVQSSHYQEVQSN